MNNKEIRKAMLDNRIHQWEVAKAIGIHEGTLVRWMRDELSEDKKDVIMDAIQKLKR